MPLRQHEQIAIFYKKLPTYNPQFTEGKPLHGKGNAYKNKELKNQNYVTIIIQNLFTHSIPCEIHEPDNRGGALGTSA